MPKPGFMPREGVYIDPLASVFKTVIINPLFIVLSSAATFVEPIRSARSGNRLIHLLPFLAGFGVLLRVNELVNQRFKNNFQLDNTWKGTEELVLITGAASNGGIGQSICKHLFAARIKTIILDIAPMGYDYPKDLVHYYQCDLRDTKAIASTVARIRTEIGHPTVLINNAGLARGWPVAEGSYADKDTSVKVMLLAPLFLTQEVLPNMIKQNHGHIISLSSMSAFVPPAGIADYAACKAGIVTMHDCLSLELKHVAPKVRLSCIIPGFIRTPLLRGMAMPQSSMDRFLAPLLHVDTVGDAIAGILFSGLGKDVYLPGIMRYLAGMRAMPSWFQHVIRNSTEHVPVDLFREK